MPVIGAPLSVATGTSMRMAPLRAATSNSQPMQMIMKPCFIRKPSPMWFCPAVAVQPERRRVAAVDDVHQRDAVAVAVFGRRIRTSERELDAAVGALRRLVDVGDPALRGSFGSTAKYALP